MTTKATGKKTKTINLNMDKKIVDELERRAESMHLSRNRYCEIILSQWLASGGRLNLAEK